MNLPIDSIIPIVVSLLLGSTLGLERTLAHKTAGVRTYGLVSMGACLFVILAQFIGPAGAELGSPGQLYVLQGLIIGIGFIGGGTILHSREHHQDHTSGLTTAAGLWITAGIGAATGYGLMSLALLVTVATLVVFTVFWFFEHSLVEKQ